ncbi:MAG: DMT family transporter [Devosia sp.]
MPLPSDYAGGTQEAGESDGRCHTEGGTAVSAFYYAALGLIAGIGIPIMATLNANLAGKVGSPIVAAAFLCFLACLSLLVVLAVTGLPAGGIRWPGPTIGATAGFFAALYMFSITWLAPRIGVGNAIFLVLLGQLVSAAIIDHFALFGATQVSISWKRAAGLVLMAVGVFLARKPI